ncbi:hypothetical protein BN12_40018 [Nostocoides japonicum T1-X7]|uniref:Uncharacterized protein n=1 Tax=Nostocoides japonicum T1-X7 TaxID=1194083 RepID=A0A077LYR1_9MICO|nr:hypothetical protein [Tetrasphaera japonica]CCH79048.1 hypothetical protein BN12_40018 [Tetrasphaera japonica T1-X7]
MEITFHVNPVSAVVFLVIGVGVYLYARATPAVLIRWFGRTPISLALFCTLLPFPFLLVFLWDASRRGSRQKPDPNA